MGHYLCIHNSLKAHATAYRIYDEEFRPTQQGQISLVTACTGWLDGPNVTDESIDQFFQFDCGWILHPIIFGDYPEIMKTRIAMISELEGYPFSRLPAFSDEWIQYIMFVFNCLNLTINKSLKLLRSFNYYFSGTYDFIGLNHYWSVVPVLDPEEELGMYTADNGIVKLVNQNWTIGNSPRNYVRNCRIKISRKKNEIIKSIKIYSYIINQKYS